CGLASAVLPLLLCGMAVSVFTSVIDDDASPQAPAAPGSMEGIPSALLEAYTRAPALMAEEFPDCIGMRWQILAGIGKIESDLLAGHTVFPEGDVSPPMIGPRLDGSGVG